MLIRKQRVVEIDSVGSVLFEKSKRARHMSISVKPFKGVRVAVPRGCTYKMAKEFVIQKAPWIVKNRLKMQRLEEAQKEHRNKAVELSSKEKKEARGILINRLELLAAEYGFCYNRVFVRSQKTVWGSCSFKNNINLNIKLMELPDELRDYVIIHELVHTVIKSHGIRFWNRLNSYVSDAKEVDKRLREYSLIVL